MASLSVDDIVKIATASAQAAAREFAATAQPPTPAPATSATERPRKVELPTFDKNNIHTWIRRVEAAFGRAGVTTAQDKFFFIEAKIDVNLNPKVNEYLCGDSTEEKWEEFMEYLQEEYGKSKEQQATLFLNGIPREGLRPTQHLAKIKDLTKDITMDDLIKEMVLKDLPKSVRQSLAERTSLTAEEAAKAADFHFDKDGRPKHEAESSRICNIDKQTMQTETDDEADPVNAIGHSRFRNQNRNSGPRFQPQHRPSHPTTQTQPIGGHRNSAKPQRPPNRPWVCKYHWEFRDKAVNCEPGCQYKAKPQQSNKVQGNEMAGRRR